MILVFRIMMSTGGADAHTEVILGPTVGALVGDERPPPYSHAHGFMGFFHMLDAPGHIFFLHGGL